MPRKRYHQLSNGTLKLISLALALMLEFYFYSQDNSVTQLVSAVLEFQNIPQNRLIVDPPQAEQGIPAHIEVYGPRSVVEQVAKGFHVLKVPFPDNAPFSFPLDIHYESLRFPPSVSIQSARPARLTVRTVELVRKEVPVKFILEGELPDGFELGEVSVFPKTLILRGPLQEVQSVNKIVLEPINLDGINAPFRLELRVKAPGEFSALNVNLVSVDVGVLEKEVEKIFSSVPVLLSGADKGSISFEPSEVKVTLKGSTTLIKSLDKDSIQLQVNYPQSGAKNNLRLPILAKLPEGVKISEISPSEVKIKLVEKINR